jgi:hypothetical protein
MALERKTRSSVEAVVDWHARHINDPLARLKYLKHATPYLKPGGRRLSQRWLYGALALVPAIAIFYVTTRVASRESATSAVTQRPAAFRPAQNAPVTDHFSDVWLVDQNSEREEYSNGLQIDCHLTVPNRPRSYALFDANHLERGALLWRNDPVGIVFHTTESGQAPFEAVHNGVLKHLTVNLLDYLREKRAYNYLIDRFGRVYRVVREADAANHAGNSIWADKNWLYINLNDSFLGVSFEAQTHHGEGNTPVTPAQIRSGTLLVEMLRARYRISAANCVTHAQVSVNPTNMRVGYHTDWAANFPFRELGLPDNYARPLPGVYLCGFVFDQAYLASTGPRMLAAIGLAEQKLEDTAAAQHMTAAKYREFLQKEYRKKVTALRNEAPEGDM